MDRLLALLSQSGSEVLMSKYSFDIPALQQGQRLSIHVERSAAADGGLHVEVCIPSVQADAGPSKKRKVELSAADGQSQAGVSQDEASADGVSSNVAADVVSTESATPEEKEDLPGLLAKPLPRLSKRTQHGAVRVLQQGITTRY